MLTSERSTHSKTGCSHWPRFYGQSRDSAKLRSEIGELLQEVLQETCVHNLHDVTRYTTLLRGKGRLTIDANRKTL